MRKAEGSCVLPGGSGKLEWELFALLLFLCLALGEDDFVDEEEDHHAHAAVEDGGADVVQPAGYEVSGHGHPHAVDGVDHAECDDIPHSLPGDISVASEHPISSYNAGLAEAITVFVRTVVRWEMNVTPSGSGLSNSRII